MLMRYVPASVFAAAVALGASAALIAQGAAPAKGAPAPQGDTNRLVAGGGITAPGWMGKLDPQDEARGQKVSDAKLSMAGNVLQVTTGPAITYWNPANKATGNYTVKATFNEAKYMNLNDHPHPYGIVVAGNDMGTPEQSYLYC